MKFRRFVIFLIVFTNLVGAGVVVPTLPLYAQGQFNATAFEIAIFIALFHVAQFFAAPVLGQLSDRIGRRPVLIWSQVGTILSFCIFIFADDISQYLASAGFGIFGGGLFLLYIARVLDGITGGNITVAQAYITDITPEEDRASALGYVQVAFALGLVFGPAIGGVLAQFGLAMPFVGAAIITGFSLLMTLLVLKESVSAETLTTNSKKPSLMAAWAKYISNYTVMIILGLAFVVSFTIAALSAIFPLYAERIVFSGVADNGIVARNVGFLLAYLGAASVFSQVVLLKPIIRRFGEKNAILLSVLATFITTYGLSTYDNVWVIAAVLTPAAFAYTIGIPTGQALLTRFGDESSYGQIIGLYQSVNSLANVLGPLMGGLVFDQFGPRAPFVVASVFVVGAVFLAILLKTRTIPKTVSVQS